jgi:hypothetical protein
LILDLFLPEVLVYLYVAACRVEGWPAGASSLAGSAVFFSSIEAGSSSSPSAIVTPPARSRVFFVIISDY